MPGAFRVPNTNDYRAPDDLARRRRSALGRRPDRRGHRVRGRRHRRRGVPRAGAERRRLLPAAARLLRAGPRDLRPLRRAAGLRRGDLRVRPDRLDVRLRRLRLRPRHHHLRQGHDVGLLAARRDDRLATGSSSRSPPAPTSFAHGYTFGGHPVSAAVAPGQPGHLRAGGPQRARARAVARRSARTLEKLLDLPIVGDVRGEGFFFGIELVKDKATKETFDDDESERLLRGFLSKALFEAGLYCRADDRGDPVIQLAPPLICGPAEFAEIGADPARGADRGLDPAVTRWRRPLDGPGRCADGDDLAPRPPLDGDTDVDVAIVGGGFHRALDGLLPAARRPGACACSWSRRQVAGFGASGRNGGWCSALFPASEAALARRHGRAAALAMGAAMRDTVDEVGQAVGRGGHRRATGPRAARSPLARTAGCSWRRGAVAEPGFVAGRATAARARAAPPRVLGGVVHAGLRTHPARAARARPRAGRRAPRRGASSRAPRAPRSGRAGW